MIRHVVVLDAADLDTVSAFWAGMFGGRAVPDDTFHSVVDRDGRWVLGVQLSPDHVPPDWPDGSQQQVHLDLHVRDARAAIDTALRLGARPLQTEADIDSPEGHHVYADPAGHPFCIGWGQPEVDAVRRFIASLDDRERDA